MGLVGPIPASLRNLRQLQELVIANNNIADIFPEWIGTSFPRLRKLKLLENLAGPFWTNYLEKLPELEVFIVGCPQCDPSALPFADTLPSSMSRMARLKILDCSYSAVNGWLPSLHNPLLEEIRFAHTKISGPIPKAFSFLPSLTHLDLSHSALSGQIPDDIGKLTKLKTLNLQNTGLAGVLPASIGQLSSLEYLSLSLTALARELPPTFGNLTNLKEVSLDAWRNLGQLPNDLSRLTNLVNFTARYAGLTGTVPSSLLQLPALKRLYLSHNSLEGTLPPARGHFCAIDLSNNLLRGPLDDFVSFGGQTANFENMVFSSSTDLADPYFGPEFTVEVLNLSMNKLSGTLPALMVTNSVTTSINLIHNRLGGTLPNELSSNDRLEYLNLGHNKFDGTIPNSWESLARTIMVINLSGNMLTGSIPASLFQLPLLSELILADNRLSSTIPEEIEMSHSKALKHLDLSFNLLSGTIISFGSYILDVINLSNNNLTGGIPAIPVSTYRYDVSFNDFDSIRPFFIAWSDRHRLAVLDISENRLSGVLSSFIPISTMVWFAAANNGFSGSLPYMPWAQIQHLDLSGNRFSGDLPRGLCDGGNLVYLDLSDNLLSGQIPFSMFSNLATWPSSLLCPIATLKLHSNHLSGGIHNIINLPSLTSLDIHNNSFAFDTSDLTQLPSLISLDVSHNCIHGSLSLSGLINLQRADFSYNALNQSFDLRFIQGKFQAKLQFFSIIGNQYLPTYITDDISAFGLQPTNTSWPSKEHRNVECQQLVFSTDPATYFGYDDRLFNWIQCYCTDRFFGIPPDRCFSCPDQAKCAGNRLELFKDHFLYSRSNASALEIPFDQLPAIPQGSSDSSSPWGVESCLPSLEVTESNCNGSTILIPRQNGAHNTSSGPVFIAQCLQGSTGRLCSKCTCPQSGEEPCYFMRGELCTKCKHVYNAKVTIPVLLAFVLILQILLTVFMTLALSGKRRIQRKSWEELTLLKRVVYRCLHGLNLGLLPITINFIQIVSQLTHWNAYALRAWSDIFNGNAESMGLQCLFPFISSPTAMLLTRLALPLAAIIVINSSILLADLVDRRRELWPKFFKEKDKEEQNKENEESDDVQGLLHHRQQQKQQQQQQLLLSDTDLSDSSSALLSPTSSSSSYFSSSSVPLRRSHLRRLRHAINGSSDDYQDGVQEGQVKSGEEDGDADEEEEEETQLDEKRAQTEGISPSSSSNPASSDVKRRDVELQYYPVSALMSTSTISIVQFFYFGSVLAATQYFFYSVQEDSELKYVQAEPWMEWREASSLRVLSVPVLVIFLLGVPLLFSIIAWRVRHRVAAPTTAIYFGTLFSRFKRSYFWWEVVNVVKRLAIALALQGISSTSALMPSTVTTLICICLLLQTTFKPWKRPSENLMDPISSVLLLLSLFASFSNKMPQSSAVILFVLTLDISFVLTAVIIGVYQMVNGTTEYQYKWKFKQSGVPPVEISSSWFGEEDSSGSDTQPDQSTAS